jgi:hypothetical protein
MCSIICVWTIPLSSLLAQFLALFISPGQIRRQDKKKTYGQTALTLTLFQAASFAAVLVKPSIPCFEVQYGAIPGEPICPATLDIFTIDPACVMSLSCARRQLKTPTRLMLMTFINSSSLNSSIGFIAT